MIPKSSQLDEQATLSANNDIDIAVKEESKETSIANAETKEADVEGTTTLGEIDGNTLDEILSSAMGASDIGGEEEVVVPSTESEGREGDDDASNSENENDSPLSKSSEGGSAEPTTPTAEAERQSIEQPVVAAGNDEDDDNDAPPSLLSSDGKEIFEPDPDATKVDPQNVEMGLFVLTRSLLALKSIVEKE